MDAPIAFEEHMQRRGRGGGGLDSLLKERLAITVIPIRRELRDPIKDGGCGMGECAAADRPAPVGSEQAVELGDLTERGRFSVRGTGTEYHEGSLMLCPALARFTMPTRGGVLQRWS